MQSQVCAPNTNPTLEPTISPHRVQIRKTRKGNRGAHDMGSVSHFTILHIVLNTNSFLKLPCYFGIAAPFQTLRQRAVGCKLFRQCPVLKQPLSCCKPRAQNTLARYKRSTTRYASFDRNWMGFRGTESRSLGAYCRNTSTGVDSFQQHD
jgi:hypothetical protein